LTAELGHTAFGLNLDSMIDTTTPATPRHDVTAGRLTRG
jgi:hypothetical protein